MRAAVLARADLVGARVGTELSAVYDGWLRERLPERAGVALVAVGSLGRREPAPFSDLDLVLVHGGRPAQVREIADAVWYPIWDSGLALDHSVRTVDEAVAVARSDLKAMLGLLDVRHVAGDPERSADLRERILALWRRESTERVAELVELSRRRWAASGEAAFLLEPDLRDSRGGLRDWQTLRALGAAQLIDVPVAVADAASVLLDARTELHRATGRATDVLRAQEQGPVAVRLGLAGDDALLRRVNEAARTLAQEVDVAWRRVLVAPRRPGRLSQRWRRGPDPGARLPLARDVVAQGGEVVLARDADPGADPVLGLRVARAAAQNTLPIAPFALDRLLTESARLPEPWPPEARTEFVALLDAGHAAVAVLESLDRVGLLTRLIPEWQSVRFGSQRNPVHRFTVDRHLLETAAEAAAMTRRVSRPDLLLVGALLHDIGKGYPGDHSVVGAEVAAPIARRMGFGPADVARIVALVRHHLLLPDTATRRDPDDAVTLALVADAIDGSGELLDQLHTLAVADATATGPAAWSNWKAGLVDDLVTRTHAVLSGMPPATSGSLDRRRRALAEAGATAVTLDGGEMVVAVPDGPGVLSRTAGVLALHSFEVRRASIATHRGMAVNAFTVAPRFGDLPDPAVLRSELTRALDGGLPLAERLAAKERAYRGVVPGAGPPPAPARVLWFDDEATDATVVELRAADSFGLLYRVTAALEAAGLDVRSARVATVGSSVVDAFYVTGPGGGPVTPDLRPSATHVLLAAAVLPPRSGPARPGGRWPPSTGDASAEQVLPRSG